MLTRNYETICSLVQLNVKYSSEIFLAVLHQVSSNNLSIYVYRIIFMFRLPFWILYLINPLFLKQWHRSTCYACGHLQITEVLNYNSFSRRGNKIKWKWGESNVSLRLFAVSVSPKSLWIFCRQREQLQYMSIISCSVEIWYNCLFC